MENQLSMNIYETSALPEVVPRKKVLVVEDDITYRPLWAAVLRRISPSIELDWAMGYRQAKILLEDSSKGGEPYDMVVLDIFLSGPKTGLDLWSKYSVQYGDSMVMVSSIAEEKLENYLTNSLERPLYLKKPLQIEQCDEVARYLLNME